jgi:hypothetical protein
VALRFDALSPCPKAICLILQKNFSEISKIQGFTVKDEP